MAKVRMSNNEIRALATKLNEHPLTAKSNPVFDQQFFRDARTLAVAVLDNVRPEVPLYRSPSCEDRGPQPTAPFPRRAANG